MLPPRWLADQMLGRLARYLRFVGLDVAYVRDLEDAAVVSWARSEGRFLLTRDRALARRFAESLEIESTGIAGQWREVRTAYPGLPTVVRLARCSLCNGELTVYTPGAGERPPPGAPAYRVASGLILYRCGACGHIYWDGSHSADVQRRITGWSLEADP